MFVKGKVSYIFGDILAQVAFSPIPNDQNLIISHPVIRRATCKSCHLPRSLIYSHKYSISEEMALVQNLWLLCSFGAALPPSFTPLRADIVQPLESS